MASAIVASAAVTRVADLLGVVLGEHPDVVDEVGEQRRDDAPVAVGVATGSIAAPGRPRRAGA